MNRSGSLQSLALLLGLGVLAGCASAPQVKVSDADLQPPSASLTALPATAAAPVPGGEAQRLSPQTPVSAQWWTLFRSPALDQWVRRALANSPSLVAAQAALQQAQENYNAQVGGLQYPSVTGQVGASRQRASSVSTGVPGGSLYNLYNASVNVSYTVDLFGANQRALEGQQALVDYQRYQLEAATLSLSANLVTTALREASLRAQLAASQDVLRTQERQLTLLERQLSLGAINQAPVLGQRSLVTQTRATLPALEKSLAQTRNQLAVYAGVAPGDDSLPVFDLDSLQLPQDLPLTLPSALVRQRPDIRAAEALLYQAAAQVGVAQANLYPQLTLSGSYGTAATKEGNFLGNGFGFWSLASGLTAPLFNGGALDAKRRAAEAAYQQALAQYRSTVLQGFQNVADSLRALEFDAATLQAQVQAQDQAHASLALVRQQYEAGATSSLALLDAQRTEQQARISVVAARAARYADTAALFQALGGGWWNRP